MALLNGILGLCALVVSFIPHALGDCQSFGVDYTNGGKYFTNTHSTDFFNFTSFFEGEGLHVETALVLQLTEIKLCRM